VLTFRRRGTRSYHAVVSDEPGPQDGLIPEGLDFEGAPAFVYDTLCSLRMLGHEPPVQQYLQANPGIRAPILALSQVVAETGVRVGQVEKERPTIAERLKLYTPEEIWEFDLAIDVTAMFAANGGLTPDSRVILRSHLDFASELLSSHRWKHELHKAGQGPGQFRALRAHVPRHHPKP
jgi:hypothetical protein